MESNDEEKLAEVEEWIDSTLKPDSEASPQEVEFAQDLRKLKDETCLDCADLTGLIWFLETIQEHLKAKGKEVDKPTIIKYYHENSHTLFGMAQIN